MTAAYRILESSDLRSVSTGAQSDFARDVLAGLSATPKTLPSRYIYDDAGSELFTRIMELPEYYPTRCEQEILETRANDIAAAIGGRPFNLVELGAGDGRKTAVLLREFSERGYDFQYVPIDISEAAVSGLVDRLAGELPALRVDGVVADYFDGLRWVSRLGDRLNVVLFLGSNIGNFRPPSDVQFLHSLWNSLNCGDLLLVGFDLKKDIDQLVRAYSDSAGVTAAFNLNLLHRINRELGGRFDVSTFRFWSTWDPVNGAVQSYLISDREQTVRIDALEKEVSFEPWEPIHTESSHKYTARMIEELAGQTGFAVMEMLSDAKGWFCDAMWRVLKD
ncbi:MAG: L-histidine N(alpha)-methyltransferase [Planctomycetota bacterium]